MSSQECDHLVQLARSGLHKSGVVDAETGGSLVSDIRTSSGAFIGRGHDSTTSAIERRIALWSQIPEDHGEAIQVLRYQHGEEYRAHFDYFFHKAGMGNNRIATVLLYLSDVEEGGETVFPNTAAPGGRTGEWSPCAANSIAVKPVKGDALLFWSMKVGGELDGGSSHAGCPVIRGEKWTATKWCAKHGGWQAAALTVSDRETRAGCTWRLPTRSTRTNKCLKSRARLRWRGAMTRTSAASLGRNRGSASATPATCSSPAKPAARCATRQPEPEDRGHRLEHRLENTMKDAQPCYVAMAPPPVPRSDLHRESALQSNQCPRRAHLAAAPPPARASRATCRGRLRCRGGPR